MMMASESVQMHKDTSCQLAHVDDVRIYVYVCSEIAQIMIHLYLHG